MHINCLGHFLNLIPSYHYKKKLAISQDIIDIYKNITQNDAYFY
jgi:hypothetical protein